MKTNSLEFLAKQKKEAVAQDLAELAYLSLDFQSIVQGIKVDENFFEESLTRILEKMATRLKFERGQVIVVVDELENIVPVNNYKNEVLYKSLVATFGFRGAELADEVKYFNDLRSNNTRVDLENISETNYVLRTGNFLDEYPDEEFIRKITAKGITKPDYFGRLKKQYYGSYLPGLQAGQRKLSLEEYARIVLFPINKLSREGLAILGYISFDTPLTGVNPFEPISEYNMHYAQATIDQAVLPIMVSGFVKEIQALNEMLTQQAVMSAAGELASVAAHDIGNSNQNISINLQEIRNKIGKSSHGRKVLSELEAISEASRNIETLTSEFSSFGATLSSKKEYLYLGEIVDTTLKMLGTKLKDVNVQKNYLSKAGVIGNRDKLIALYANILGNAYDALKGIPDKRIDIRLEENGNRVKVTIRDNGLGINSDQLPKVFVPRFSTKGTQGLGLHSAYMITQDHQGVIVAKSRKKEYFEITTDFPISQA